jgi:hypothetical protein
MMVYPYYVIAGWLVAVRKSVFARILLASLVGGIIMTTWDLGYTLLMNCYIKHIVRLWRLGS